MTFSRKSTVFSTPLMSNHKVSTYVSEVLQGGGAVSVCEIDGLKTLLRSSDVDELITKVNSLERCLLVVRHHTGETEHFKLYRT